MNTKRVFAALLFCAAGVMAAQETPKFDLFGGYSYGRIRNSAFPGRSNFQGWDSSLTYNVNDWLGLVVEVSGHYGSHVASPLTEVFVCQPNQIGCPLLFRSGPVTLDSRLHTYEVGPRFTWRTGRMITPFVHVLAGGGNSSETVDFGAVQSRSNKNSWFWKTGGGFDLSLNPRVSWRTQTDAWFSFHGQHNFQLSTGPVFHFGRK